MANALLRDVAVWRASGQLRPDAANRLQEALIAVPGADVANATVPTTTTAPPPTAPPPPPADAEDNEGEGKGEKRGKGKGEDD